MTEVSEQPTTPDAKKTSQGAIAQLGERLPCTQEVVGSIPSGPTSFLSRLVYQRIDLNERSRVFSSLNQKVIWFGIAL